MKCFLRAYMWRHDRLLSALPSLCVRWILSPEGQLWGASITSLWLGCIIFGKKPPKWKSNVYSTFSLSSCVHISCQIRRGQKRISQQIATGLHIWYSMTCCKISFILVLYWNSIQGNKARHWKICIKCYRETYSPINLNLFSERHMTLCYSMCDEKPT